MQLFCKKTVVGGKYSGNTDMDTKTYIKEFGYEVKLWM
jgi:hypothetical protein